MNAVNLPRKRNLKRLNGLDAITGKGNFDIGEYILLRMLELFANQHGTLAMLCKNSVIRNIVEVLPQRGFRVCNVRACGIDASSEFGASVDASLLVMEMGAKSPTFYCQVSTLDEPDQSTRIFGWMGSKFVSDMAHYEPVADIDSESPIIWRQGLKHDCTSIMELDDIKGSLINGSGTIVDIESEWVYCLLKGSDLRSIEADRPRKKVIVTQRHTGDDTSVIQTNAPKLWEYLLRNREYLERRKSSIYRGRPPFSIFGIGDYSFKPYKVAISGLHKQPRFSLVLPIDGRPVMLDDTCYFLGFDTYLDALFNLSILISPPVHQFLQSIVFTDAKRPYTKEALMRIDLSRAARQLPYETLCRIWADSGYTPRMRVVEADFEVYKQALSTTAKKDEGVQLELLAMD